MLGPIVGNKNRPKYLKIKRLSDGLLINDARLVILLTKYTKRPSERKLNMDLHNIRADYSKQELSEQECDASPLVQFERLAE